ncbi:hypothetical protein BDZ94DRAFT_742907 [Collybia nuda]|uniref:Uncharacterized protein n=1 Tax=Collybia nuda TaxID=64659 RepID=A0A9P5Y4S4_9AGAR|nr:hypothetical protein BDZ94DRAFT_742907 [Collybia nuda]
MFRIPPTSHYPAPQSFSAPSSLCFEKLKILEIRYENLNDTIIHNLALACPNLQKLYLPIDSPNPSKDPQSVSPIHNAMFSEEPGPRIVDTILSSQSHTTLTIVSLWSLAECCPKLTHLQIGLDITTTPPFFNSNVHSHGLSDLAVGSYDCAVDLYAISNIARHILRLFPHVMIKSQDGHNSMAWEQIAHTIDIYKRIVSDENKRRLGRRATNDQSTNFLSH